MRSRATAGAAACLVLVTCLARAQVPARPATSCEKLEADERRSVDPTIELALASCYGLANRPASALMAARRAGDAFATAGDPRVDQARLMEAQFEARAPRLRIIVSQLVSGMTVTRNGQRLLPADWGVDMPIDPGTVQVDASAPGYRSWSTRMQVDSGQKTIEIPPLSAAQPAAIFQAKPARDTSSGSSPARTAAWVSGAAGLTAIGVGTAFGIMSMIAHDEADRRCDRGPSRDLCDREGLHQNQIAMQRGDVATGAFLAGGALLGLGIALYFGAAEPQHPGSNAARLQIVPKGFAGGAGAVLKGTF